jgi:geranylgeranyl pyrophosphate synthase
VITLPLILSLRKNADFANKAGKLLRSNSVGTRDVSWIVNEILRLGGIDDARVWMDRYLYKAMKMLEPLPNYPEKQVFTELVGHLRA